MGWFNFLKVEMFKGTIPKTQSLMWKGQVGMEEQWNNSWSKNKIKTIKKGKIHGKLSPPNKKILVLFNSLVYICSV